MAAVDIRGRVGHGGKAIAICRGTVDVHGLCSGRACKAATVGAQNPQRLAFSCTHARPCWPIKKSAAAAAAKACAGRSANAGTWGNFPPARRTDGRAPTKLGSGGACSSSSVGARSPCRDLRVGPLAYEVVPDAAKAKGREHTHHPDGAGCSEQTLDIRQPDHERDPMLIGEVQTEEVNGSGKKLHAHWAHNLRHRRRQGRLAHSVAHEEARDLGGRLKRRRR